MNDIIRISVYLASFVLSLYTLQGVDFSKVLRKHAGARGQMLYLLVSIALAYCVAQFFLGLSLSYIM